MNGALPLHSWVTGKCYKYYRGAAPFSTSPEGPILCNYLTTKVLTKLILLDYLKFDNLCRFLSLQVNPDNTGGIGVLDQRRGKRFE